MEQITTPDTLTIGPVTTNLLLSLRHVEEAREYLYKAYGEEYGEDIETESVVEKKMEAVGAHFDALRDKLQNDISERIYYWANNLEPGEI